MRIYGDVNIFDADDEDVNYRYISILQAKSIILVGVSFQRKFAFKEK